MDSVLIPLILLLCIVGGGAWFYLKVSETRNVNDAIQNIGRLLIVFVFIVLAMIMALAFTGG